MDKQDQTKQQEPNREQERTSNTGNEPQQKGDISHIKDRQEGEMDNGELCGNMGQKKEERNKE